MIDIRPIVDDIELAKFSLCQATAFGFDFIPERLETRRATFEFERSLAAFDGDRVVGTAGIFSFMMGVPGGELATGGVTMVSVLPTHRRRGILSSMMREQLTRVRDRGEAMAALWASESIIYNRFGYGMAAETVEIDIKRAHVRIANGPATPGETRIVNVEEARESWPVLWDEVRLRQPGMMTRSQAWWTNRVFRDPESQRDGFTANVYVNYEADGELRGYLRYRRKQQWDNNLPNGIVRVEELIAKTDDAYHALWQYALNLDLVGNITADMRTTDEALFWMLADRRRLIRKPVDSLWLRVVNVPAALEGRKYLSGGEIVLDVRDPFLGSGGRFLLQAWPDGARCTATEQPADIELGIDDLASVYLGGYRFRTLARAGRVSGSEEALNKADVLFGWPVAPWCPEIF